MRILETIAVTTMLMPAMAAGTMARATDPYDGKEPTRPGTTGAIVEQSNPCISPCAALHWEVLADVISVTGTGDGVEGAAAGVVGDELYIPHGYSFGDTTNLRIYDIASDTWRLGPDASVIRSEGAGAAIGDKVFSIGGRTDLADVEIFDVTAGTWSGGTAMPTARKGTGIAVVNGLIHVVGGANAGASGPTSGTPVAAHEVYDPATDSWSTRAPMPQPRGDVYATTAVGSKLYAVGGWDGGAATADTFIYDSVTDTWSTGAPMPTPRTNAVAGTLGGAVIVIGGLDDAGTNLTVVEVYDPVADTWCDGPPKPTPASELAAPAPTTTTTIFAVGTGAFGASGNTHEALILTGDLVQAEASPDDALCVGATATLDGSGSTGCTGSSIQYRWLDGTGTPACNWSPAATCDVTPAATTTYTLEVECTGSPGCNSSATTTVTVDGVDAASSPDALICVGEMTTLDGSGSAGCTGSSIAYRWLDGAGAPACNWSPNATCDVTPAATTTYTLEVECTGSPGCNSSAATTVTVDGVDAASSPDDLICAGDMTTLDGSGSAGCTSSSLQYRWLDGTGTPACNWSPVATCDVTPAATTTYTLEVECAGAPGCAASAATTITIDPCIVLSAHFGELLAVRHDNAIRVTWSTLSEDGSTVFAVERASDPAGPFTIVGSP